MDSPSIQSKPKKHYVVEIKYDDPYPKKWESRPIEARSHERAIVFATRAFKKTRPRKRMPKLLYFRSQQL